MGSRGGARTRPESLHMTFGQHDASSAMLTFHSSNTACTCTRTHAHAHTRTRTRTRTHTHTHAHTRTRTATVNFSEKHVLELQASAVVGSHRGTVGFERPPSKRSRNVVADDRLNASPRNSKSAYIPAHTKQPCTFGARTWSGNRLASAISCGTSLCQSAQSAADRWHKTGS